MRRDPVLQQLEQEWSAMVAAVPRERLMRPDWLQPIPGYGPMQALVPMRATALFAELEDVRREWQELREWPVLRKHAEAKVNPGWTYKDLLAHLASWAVEMYREAEGATQGAAFDYEIHFEPKVGPTQWNARAIEVRNAMTLEEIFDEFDDAVTRMQDLLIEVTPAGLARETRFPICMGPDPLVATIGRITAMKCFHDRYHFEQIRTRLAALEQESRYEGRE